MIKLGIVDFDTSHVVQFSMRLNHIEIGEDQWVDGAQVVCGCPGTSAILAQEKVDEYTEKLRGFGIEILARPEDMLGKIDAVLIESVDGSVHLERVRPFIEAGLHCYIDKPFACSLADAKEIVTLAEKKGVALFSSSSLRYAVEVQDILSRKDEVGAIIGADAYSPASLDVNKRNPGLYHYGIHGVETLYALMGPGCQSVVCTFSEGGEIVTGIWNDGRIGSMRGTRAGAHAYGFTAWGEKQVVQSPINPGNIYRELLKRIVGMFETGQSPLDPRETMEIMGFIEAAMQSAADDGRRVKIDI